MASAHLVDAIQDPSRVIIDLYDGGTNAGVDFPGQVTAHFTTIFHTLDSIKQVSFTVVCDRSWTWALRLR